MAYETMIYEKKGRIAYVTLNRPEAGNSFNTVLCREITEIWEDVMTNDDVWVVIITGAGGRFLCTGIDVKEATTTKMGDIWLPIARMMAETYKPVILAVNGVCAGGGLHFLCDSDIAICSENASFLDPHVNVGFVTGWEPVALSRRIPLGYVLKMALMGSKFRIDAQKALEIGLVTEVVPLDELMPRATEIAEIILENSPLAVRYSKKAIMQGLNMGLSGALENSAPILKEVWDTEDHAEGKRAFAEKRRPVWKAM